MYSRCYFFPFWIFASGSTHNKPSRKYDFIIVACFFRISFSNLFISLTRLTFTIVYATPRNPLDQASFSSRSVFICHFMNWMNCSIMFVFKTKFVIRNQLTIFYNRFNVLKECFSIILIVMLKEILVCRSLGNFWVTMQSPFILLLPVLIWMLHLLRMSALICCFSVVLQNLFCFIV